MNVGEEKLQPACGTLFLGAVDRARKEENSRTSTDADTPPRQLCKADLVLDDLSDFTFGQYQLLNRLGRGGMGVVYLAKHLQLEKDFAIKFIANEIHDQSEARERFVKEFKSLGRLQHPNIICAVDAGSIGDISYYVTELLNGQDLASWMGQRPLPSLGTLCELIRQSALGLHHAHLNGLLHRDIKPSNLFLEASGNVKLLDFGLVGSYGESNGLTRSNQLMGTLDYISPEQAENPLNCTPASDIYSLGATMLYLLSGCPPFPDKYYPSEVSKLRGHLNDVPWWLQYEAASLPEALRTLVASMLSKAHKDRPQSAKEVADALSTWSETSELLAWINELPVNRAVRIDNRQPSAKPVHEISRKKTKRLWPYIVAGCVVCLSLASVVRQVPFGIDNQHGQAIQTPKNAELVSSIQSTKSTVSSQVLNARPMRIDATSTGHSKKTSFAPKPFSSRD